MNGLQNTNMIKVFISSNCDSSEERQKGNIKYEVMRRSLKLLLESTGICEVYIFEEGTATSYDVVSSYMNPLEDSDLAIVIVDNKDGIGAGTQKEINRIAAINKKCIYVFCNEREKEHTELEKHLLKSITNPRYITVKEFAGIPEAVFKSVINDILGIYTSYCRGRITQTETKIYEESKGTGDTGFNVPEDCAFSKDYLSQFIYTKSIMKKEAGLFFGEKMQISDKDKRCADLFGNVIGSQLTDLPDFNLIKQDIKQLHKGNMQKLVSIRYEAVEEYFIGNLQGCIGKLEQALAFVNTCKNIPKWVLNDIALDLRNVQLEIDYEKGIYNLNTLGQSILDEDEEPLYYPVIDRIISDYNECIIKNHFEFAIQSPYTVKLGGVDYNVEKTVNAFIVAYFYGSITHMLLTRKRICNYILELSLEVRNHRMFMLAVRLLLLTNEEKLLRQFLSTYGENTNNINSTDVDNLLDSLSKQPVTSRRILARIHTLGLFGYYYSDEVFNNETGDLLCTVKESILTELKSGIYIKPLLESIKDTLFRFSQKEVLEFVYYIFTKKCSRYYDDAFNLLYHFRFTEISKKDQKKYQGFMIKQLKDENIRNNAQRVYQAVQTLRQCENIDHKPLDKVVKKYNKSFYESTYCINVGEYNSAEWWKYTELLLENIRNENMTQGKGGLYSGRFYDSYLTVSNIILNHNLSFSSSQMKKVLDVIKETLFMKTQTIEAKYRALELLCVIQLHQSSNQQVARLYKEIAEKNEEIYNAKDLFLVKGFGNVNIDLIISVLGVILKHGKEKEIGFRLVGIQNSEISEQITALNFLERIFNFNILNLLTGAEEALFNFLLHESYSNSTDVRFRAMSVMTKIKKSSYQEICLERFVDIMDNEDYKGKVGLLYRLKEEDFKSPKVRFIFEKGKIDNHFWVRTAAQRFDQ